LLIDLLIFIGNHIYLALI